MKFKKHLFFVAIACFAILSCKKNNDPTPNVDVYLAGTNSPFVNGNAAYWKNGVLTILSDNNTGRANAITVNGSDVYAAGYTFNNFNNNYPIGSNDSVNNNPTIGTYWKNGTATMLGPNTMCTSIAVNGTDIYVAGYFFIQTIPTGFNFTITDNHTGMYWKNGVATTFGPNTICTSIAVVGSDVYVAGAINNNAAYWKNGILTKLPGGTSGSVANAILVIGNNIYIAGTTYFDNNSTATYWKNGIITELTSDASISEASSIAINDSNIYIAGSFGGKAAYWKNGVVTVLADLSILTESEITSIAVNNNNVYALGNYALGLNNIFWKNGVAANTGLATAMTIVFH